MNQNKTFIFEKIPSNLSEFLELEEVVMENPLQTAALTVLALCIYCEDKEIGIEILNTLKGPQPLSTYEQQFLNDRLTDKEYLIYSYFEGATPENNYTPDKPFKITVMEDPYSYLEEGYAKLLIKSSGADQSRPIKLRCKSNEKWFLWEQFLLSDIKQSIENDPWA